MTRRALSTLAILHLQQEAIAAGDDKTIADCALILAEDTGPGDVEYDDAMTRICTVAKAARAKELEEAYKDGFDDGYIAATGFFSHGNADDVAWQKSITKESLEGKP